MANKGNGKKPGPKVTKRQKPEVPGPIATEDQELEESLILTNRRVSWLTDSFLVVLSLVIGLATIYLVYSVFFNWAFFTKKAGKVTLALYIILIILSIVVGNYAQYRKEELKRESRFKATKINAANHPDEYAWQLAQESLDQYFERNLKQLRYIFWISISVMTTGFLFILIGIYTSMGEPDSTTYLAGIAGIITEFLGATFMFIYKSTHQKASEHMNVLERINTVGMAFQIANSIDEEGKTLKNETKAILSRLIMKDSLAELEASLPKDVPV